ncbi:MAG: NUDIX hydrolase [Clostridium sp.]
MNIINDIKKYKPFNIQEEKDKELILSGLKSLSDIFTRDNKFIHMTSSSYIVNKSHTKVLMIHHKIYNSWSWTGGHNDGDFDCLNVALKEAYEETGIKNLTTVINEIFSLDVLPVKGHFRRGEFVSPHLHLNVAYLLEACEEDELTVNVDETNGVKWLPIDKISEFCSEPEMVKLYNKFNEKIGLLTFS